VLSLVGTNIQAASPEGWDKTWSDCSKKHDADEQKCTDGTKKFGDKAKSAIAIKQLQGCMSSAQDDFNKCMNVGLNSVKSKDGKPLTDEQKKASLALLAKIGTALNKCEATTEACLQKAYAEPDNKKGGDMRDDCLKNLDKCTDDAQNTKVCSVRESPPNKRAISLIRSCF